MKKLRGTRAVALAASVAMLFSAFAISPANAAEGECPASTQATFETCLDQGYSTIKISGDKNKVLSFGIETAVIKLGSVIPVNHEVTGYGKVATETVNHAVTIVADEETTMRNVQFDVTSTGSLTFGNNVILDDAELSGINLAGLIQLGNSGSPSGIEYGVNVNGGTFTMTGNARMAVGAGDRTLKPNRAIVVSSNGSTVNLNSSGTYDRKGRAYLATIHLDLSSLGFLGDLLDKLVDAVNDVVGILSVSRDVAYPTVWGRDAAVYSEPNVNNATINITDGSYSNQKDKEAVGKTYLNGAVSSSATVNIAGTGNVQISNTKIGNDVDKNHNGSTTTGTLNISNPNAVLDPGTEKDGDATKHATDSWALELRGSAVANIVAGSIQDTSSHTTKQVIEAESNSRVNILSASDKGDVKIATTRQYYIAQPAKDGAAFSSQVTYAASEGEANADAYELWSSGATTQTTTLAQLQDLVAKETAGSTPAAAKLSQSTYTTGKISAAYLEDVNKDGRAVYGRHEISFNGSTPVQSVNKKDAPGKVVLYSLPWVGKYDTGGTAPEVTNKLFAGWYTSEDAWKAEDKNQQSKDARDRYHVWDESKADFNGTYEDTVVVNTAKYTGTLYPHFVDAKTMGSIGVQTAGTKDGRYNLRFLAGVDGYDFKSFEFSLTYNGKNLGVAKSRAIYEYITALGAKQVFADSPFAGDSDYSTEMLGDQGDARYITSAVINNVKPGATLVVTPSWYTLDGVKVTGTPFSVTLNADGSVYKQYK